MLFPHFPRMRTTPLNVRRAPPPLCGVLSVSVREDALWRKPAFCELGEPEDHLSVLMRLRSYLKVECCVLGRSTGNT